MRFVQWMQVPARDAVVDTVKRIFAVHGAVPMDSAYVGACPVDAPPDMAALLSASGARLAMRCARKNTPKILRLGNAPEMCMLACSRVPGLQQLA